MISDTERLQAVPLKDVTIEKGFWAERQATNHDRTIPAIYRQMKDTGRLDAWRLDWKIGQIPKPHIFWDSDAGKWIEAVGYSLTTRPSPEFEKQVDEVIELIEKAQQPDGYLNIFFTSVEPENRWKNLRDWHELYDAGHLIGLVSHRDLIELFALGKIHRQAEIIIRDVMKTDLITVRPETPTLDALELMREKKIGCLPVVKDNKLVGIITAHDFLTVSAKLFEERLGGVLQKSQSYKSGSNN